MKEGISKKERMQRFMAGRYGNDQLNQFIFIGNYQYGALRSHTGSHCFIH